MREWLYCKKRKIEKKINALHFKYMNNRYAIAFRKRAGNPLYKEEGSGEGFTLIKHTLRYWMADPFLFEDSGENYIFAELFDKRKSKGVLGYAKLRGNKCGKFRVCLEEDYHLSFPCLFKKDNEIYMLPEAKESNSVTLYRAIDFPKKWEPCQIICERPCVDTTPFTYRGRDYYFTTIANEHSTDDNLFLIDSESGEVTKLLSNNLCLRSAGKIIYDEGQIIRPSQDDTVYGDAVVFNRILNFDKKNYKEIPYKRILPPGEENVNNTVSINILNNSQNIKFNGLHTYNINDNYEVVDLRYPRIKKGR